jgi:S-adenosylmethionine/arginine decarboxylase-like enzyme
MFQNFMKIGHAGAEFHADGQTVIVLLAESSLFVKYLPEHEKTQICRIVKPDCR